MARDAIWTDGSRSDSGRVGAACAWRTQDGWAGRRFYLGNNKEVSDAELFAICLALRVFRARQESGRNNTVFSDSQSAIRRALPDVLGPGQQWARAIIEVASEIVARDNEIALFWVPAHSGVAGKEVADNLTKEAAEGPPLRVRGGFGRGPLAD